MARRQATDPAVVDGKAVPGGKGKAIAELCTRNGSVQVGDAKVTLRARALVSYSMLVTECRRLQRGRNHLTQPST
jgi:hypothetical protein